MTDPLPSVFVLWLCWQVLKHGYRLKRGKSTPRGKQQGHRSRSATFWRALQDYYKSEEWQTKRREAFTVYGRKCCVCGTTERLDVHHTKYPPAHRLGKEPVAWLRVVCRTHHEEIHGRKIG